MNINTERALSIESALRVTSNLVRAALVGLALVYGASAPAVARENSAPGTSPSNAQKNLCEQTTLLAQHQVQSAVLALHQANITGNYSVLRELAHKDVQSKLSAADYAIAFRKIRAAHLDLSSVLDERMNFFSQPRIIAHKSLWAEGWFRSRSGWIEFNVILLRDANRWRLVNVSVAAVTQQTLLKHVAVAREQAKLNAAKGKGPQCGDPRSERATLRKPLY